MKFYAFLLAGVALFVGRLGGQNATPFQVSIEEVNIPGMPGVQSFVYGQHLGKWLILGGRTDGLHQRQPFASFAAADNNTSVYVVDPQSRQVWSKSLSSLPSPLYEQLQSTNMQFEQIDTVLYIIGGYGYSAIASNHITHNKLTAVNLPGAINAVINGTGIAPHFRQAADFRMAVTGGYLGYLGNKFYLAGGQEFTGRYNPHGPNHGPGFIQKYTNAIRHFEIVDDGQNLAIQNYGEWHDTANLHRRDYNMAFQIFPDGTPGYTMFSGVFQYSGDIPWLNTIDFTDTGYVVQNSFNQYLNQYHTAHLTLYDFASNAMHTVFFGGMSRYTLDASGNLVDDINVPFVNTISQVSRYADGSLKEYKIGEMPGLLGSGAEYIPLDPTAFKNSYGSVLLDSLTNQKTLVGYVLGGIESTAKNIFFTNNGSQSDASTKVYKVFVTKNVIAQSELMDGGEFFKTRLFPNPASDEFALYLQLPHRDYIRISLLDHTGKVLHEIFKGKVLSNKTLDISVNNLSPGTYLLQISNGHFNKQLPFIKE